MCTYYRNITQNLGSFFENQVLRPDYKSGVTITPNENPATITIVEPDGEPDLTLVSGDGGEYKVHRNVLKAKSVYFDRLLRDENTYKENIEGRVVFEFSNLQLKQLIDFLYHEKVVDYFWILICIDRFDIDTVAIKRWKEVDPFEFLLLSLCLSNEIVARHFASHIAERIQDLPDLKPLHDPIYWRCAVEYVFQSDRLRIHNESDMMRLFDKFEIPQSQLERMIDVCRRTRSSHYYDVSDLDAPKVDRSYMQPRRFYETHIHLLWSDYSQCVKGEDAANQSGKCTYYLTCLIPERADRIAQVAVLSTAHNVKFSQVKIGKGDLEIFMGDDTVTIFPREYDLPQFENVILPTVGEIVGSGRIKDKLYIVYEPAYRCDRNNCIRIAVIDVRIKPHATNTDPENPKMLRFDYDDVRFPCLRKLPESVNKAAFCNNYIFCNTDNKLFMVDIMMDFTKEIPMDEHITIHDIYGHDQYLMVCYHDKDIYRVRSYDTTVFKWQGIDVDMKFKGEENYVEPADDRTQTRIKPIMKFDLCEHKLLLFRSEYLIKSGATGKFRGSGLRIERMQIFEVVLEDNIVEIVADYFMSWNPHGTYVEDEDVFPEFAIVFPIRRRHCLFKRSIWSALV